MGDLEVLRPATNDCRGTFKTDRNAILRWAIAKDVAQSLLDVGDCLAAYPEFGRRVPGMTNINRDVESEKLVAVPHVGNPGLFGRQFKPAVFPKEVADLVPKPFRFLPGGSCQKHAPIVSITPRQ